jgi:hypothetical protein
MVLEIELSTNSRAAACMARWSAGVSVWASTNVGRRRLVALERMPDPQGVIDDALVALGPVGLQHVPHIVEREHRLDSDETLSAKSEIVPVGARVQQRVADTVAADRGARVLGKPRIVSPAMVRARS